MKKGADMMKMMTFLRTSLLLVIAVVFCSGFALIGKGYQVYKKQKAGSAFQKRYRRSGRKIPSLPSKIFRKLM